MPARVEIDFECRTRVPDGDRLKRQAKEVSDRARSDTAALRSGVIPSSFGRPRGRQSIRRSRARLRNLVRGRAARRGSGAIIPPANLAPEIRKGLPDLPPIKISPAPPAIPRRTVASSAQRAARNYSDLTTQSRVPVDRDLIMALSDFDIFRAAQ